MMDPILYSGESPPPWPIESTRDPLNGMPARAENITSEWRRELGLDLFRESESQSQVEVSEAEFARPQPTSIQHKIQSLLQDVDFGDRTLVQFWAPTRTASGQRMLTASHKHFKIGNRIYEELYKFRKHCAEHQYGVSVEDTTPLGPPGRVFTLGYPEFCPDVRCYSQEEFPLRKLALDGGIRGYAALALFERDGQGCVGVLELSLYEGSLGLLKVVPLEKYGFEHQVRRCKWDKTPPSFTPEVRETIRSLAQYVQENNNKGLGLVQVWVPCCCDFAPDATSSGQCDAHNSCSSSNPAGPSLLHRLLFPHYTTSDIFIRDDVSLLEPCWVRNSTSLVERASLQDQPCFLRDISLFNIFDCPLLPFLRSLEVETCFAIPLRLIHTKFDPFVLELFLDDGKTWCDRKIEDQLESFLFTLKEKCSTDQVQVEKFSVKLSHWACDNNSIGYLNVHENGSSDATAQKRLNGHPNTTGETAMPSSSRGVEVSPNATEPEITLGNIKQYFGLKLNDAAEELGVSRSTLKRICRKLGIKKWPSHKRKIVYRIQSSPRSPTRFVEGGYEVIQESEIEPPCPNNNKTERDAAASDTIPKSAKGKNIAAQDEVALDYSYPMIVKDECVQLRKKCKLKLQGVKEDVLTMALMSKEHSEHMRAVESHVTPIGYFTAPKEKAGKIDISLTQQEELMETKAKNSELDMRVQKLEAAVFKMNASAVKTDEKDSCSVKSEHPVKFAYTQPVRNFFSEEKPDDDDVLLIDKRDALQGKQVELTLAPDAQVVAFGIVVSTMVENQLPHGVPMTTCVLVLIDTAIDGSAQLPMSTTGECLCIADAVGNQVAWPVHLLQARTKRSLGRRKKKPTLEPSSMPRALYRLYCYCKIALQGGKGLVVNLADDVFGSECITYVFLDDITPFCQLQPITANCIVVYICHLFRMMKKENKVEKFRFVNPNVLGLMSKLGDDKMKIKSQLLANLLSGTSIGQLVLVPVNVGLHWILTIINPHIKNVYLLDPFSHQNRYNEWKNTVNLALKLFTEKHQKSGRNPLSWEVVKTPLQPDANQCGYFIMRYMRQIIDEYLIIENTPLQSIFSQKSYSREDIDEVRKEWAKCLEEYVQE